MRNLNIWRKTEACNNCDVISRAQRHISDTPTVNRAPLREPTPAEMFYECNTRQSFSLDFIPDPDSQSARTVQSQSEAAGFCLFIKFVPRFCVLVGLVYGTGHTGAVVACSAPPPTARDEISAFTSKTPQRGPSAGRNTMTKTVV